MPRHDPVMLIVCDGETCMNTIEIELTDMGDHNWASDTADGVLREEGWTKDGDKDLCPECSEELDNE